MPVRLFNCRFALIAERRSFTRRQLSPLVSNFLRRAPNEATANSGSRRMASECSVTTLLLGQVAATITWDHKGCGVKSYRVEMRYQSRLATTDRVTKSKNLCYDSRNDEAIKTNYIQLLISVPLALLLANVSHILPRLSAGVHRSICT